MNFNPNRIFKTELNIYYYCICIIIVLYVAYCNFMELIIIAYIFLYYLHIIQASTLSHHHHHDLWPPHFTTSLI